MRTDLYADLEGARPAPKVEESSLKRGQPKLNANSIADSFGGGGGTCQDEIMDGADEGLGGREGGDENVDATSLRVLTAEQIASFRRNGMLVVPNILDAEQLRTATDGLHVRLEGVGNIRAKIRVQPGA